MWCAVKRFYLAVILALLLAPPEVGALPLSQASNLALPRAQPGVPLALALYPSVVLLDHPVAYWHIGETSGLTATDSAGSHDGRYVGSPAQGRVGLIFGWSNLCPAFDGVNDRVTANSLASGVDWSRGFTLEVWVRVTQRTVEEHPMSFNFNNGGGNGPGLLRDEPTDRFKYRDGHPGSKGYHYALSKTIPQVGRRYYVVATVNGSGQGALYVNGVKEASFTTPARPPTTGGQFTIGAEYDSGLTPMSFWHGRIDEPAVYNHALSATRVKAHWLAGRFGIG
jgi:hypothetical protein